LNGVLSLDQLFHKRVFRVPDYQRGFAWEAQQIEEFLEDLEVLAEGRHHYTGTVVLHDPGSQTPRMDADGNGGGGTIHPQLPAVSPDLEGP
jgi:hypothetical protein